MIRTITLNLQSSNRKWNNISTITTYHGHNQCGRYRFTWIRCLSTILPTIVVPLTTWITGRKIKNNTNRCRNINYTRPHNHVTYPHHRILHIPSAIAPSWITVTTPTRIPILYRICTNMVPVSMKLLRWRSNLACKYLFKSIILKTLFKKCLSKDMKLIKYIKKNF